MRVIFKQKPPMDHFQSHFASSPSFVPHAQQPLRPNSHGPQNAQSPFSYTYNFDKAQLSTMNRGDVKFIDNSQMPINLLEQNQSVFVNKPRDIRLNAINGNRSVVAISSNDPEVDGNRRIDFKGTKQVAGFKNPQSQQLYLNQTNNFNVYYKEDGNQNSSAVYSSTVGRNQQPNNPKPDSIFNYFNNVK